MTTNHRHPHARRSGAAAVAGLLLLAACEDLPVQGAPVSAARADAPQALHLGPLEQEFAEIERAAPGFAGWFYDEQGQAVMLLKDEAAAAAARARLAALLQARRAGGEAQARAPESIRVRPARYSFTELARIRETVLSRVVTEGVRSIDLDEARNTVTVGVLDAQAAARFRQAVAEQGIPAAALNVVVRERAVRPLATLEDNVRPVRGGIRVTGPVGGCSVGVNAVDASGRSGFITASHCTRSMYLRDAGTTSFHQPHAVPGSNIWQVGTEVADPSGFTGGACPSGGLCRWSDAAFIGFSGPLSAQETGRNTIHRTSGLGSKTIAGTYTVTGDAPAAKGETLHKVGATSGWTTGRVEETCVRLTDGSRDPLFNRTLWWLCTDQVQGWADHGDSGAPVFRNLGGGAVTWTGILVAGDGVYFYASSSHYVRQEFPGMTFWY